MNPMHSFRLLGVCLLVSGAVLAGGCSLDVNNPNAATEEETLTTAEGLQALAVGMQRFYATETIEAQILTPGVSAREVAITTTLANLIELEEGGAALPGSNPDVLRLWSRNYRVVEMAEDLINNVPNVPFEAGTRSGLLALAHLYKAMALGNVAQYFEQAPINTGAFDDPATFLSRQAVFEEALRLLGEARTLLAATPPSATFTNDIIAPGLDLDNTILAYQARYYLFAGNHQAALTAAGAVDPVATSEFRYDAESANPVYEQIFLSGLRYYAPRDSLGLRDFEAGDQRLDFYTDPSTTVTGNGFNVETARGFVADALGDPVQAIPAYLPGEMMLIRAEAHVRMGNLPQAVTAIDAVRTKTPAQDPYGVGAALPPYAGPVTEPALLDEIYRQRAAELFMMGLRLEDSRRLGQPLDPSDPFARTRSFYPYPDQERLNNPNTPPNPET